MSSDNLDGLDIVGHPTKVARVVATPCNLAIFVVLAIILEGVGFGQIDAGEILDPVGRGAFGTHCDTKTRQVG